MLPTRFTADIVKGFALGPNPIWVGDAVKGEQGQVWRLDTSTGSWAVKELLHREPEAEVRRSADFQDAASKAGVPAPRVVYTLDATPLLEVDGRQFRVFSWVDLLPPDPGIDPARVGAMLASMHRLAYPSAGPPHVWYTEPVGRERWDPLFRELIAARCKFGEQLADARVELCELELLLEAPSNLQQLHLDLWADNVRMTAAGDLCVIDWDNCGPGEESQELAALLFEYGGGHSERARTFYVAYLDAGGPGRVTRPENFSMAIAQLGHILEMHCAGWLVATSPERREHAEAAVEEFITRPLTRRAIDEIILAVN